MFHSMRDTEMFRICTCSQVRIWCMFQAHRIRSEIGKHVILGMEQMKRLVKVDFEESWTSREPCKDLDPLQPQ